MHDGQLDRAAAASAVAASAHAGCERFRLTDPFLTRKTRRALAAHLGSPDTSGRHPRGPLDAGDDVRARWCTTSAFVSELLTKTVGQLGWPDPTAVARVDVQRTRSSAPPKALKDAHLKADLRRRRRP